MDVHVAVPRRGSEMSEGAQRKAVRNTEGLLANPNIPRAQTYCLETGDLGDNRQTLKTKG